MGETKSSLEFSDDLGIAQFTESLENWREKAVTLLLQLDNVTLRAADTLHTQFEAAESSLLDLRSEIRHTRIAADADLSELRGGVEGLLNDLKGLHQAQDAVTSNPAEAGYAPTATPSER